MISYEDYKREDGRVDWSALSAARVACGEECRTCHQSIITRRAYRNESPHDCYDCAKMNTSDDAVKHWDRVRCPHCGWTRHAHAACEDIYREGKHTITCAQCDEEFIVETHVSHSFESPARVSTAEES